MRTGELRGTAADHAAADEEDDKRDAGRGNRREHRQGAMDMTRPVEP